MNHRKIFISALIISQLILSIGNATTTNAAMNVSAFSKWKEMSKGDKSAMTGENTTKMKTKKMVKMNKNTGSMSKKNMNNIGGMDKMNIMDFTDMDNMNKMQKTKKMGIDAKNSMNKNMSTSKKMEETGNEDSMDEDTSTTMSSEMGTKMNRKTMRKKMDKKKM